MLPADDPRFRPYSDHDNPSWRFKSLGLVADEPRVAPRAVAGTRLGRRTPEDLERLRSFANSRNTVELAKSATGFSIEVRDGARNANATRTQDQLLIRELDT